jgi:teichuronic acid exporter
MSYKSYFWSFLERFGTLITQFIILLILSRLLNPSDFGIIGLTSVFISIGGILIESGFNQTIIRTKSISALELSSIFYFNLIVSVVTYLILFIFSGWISRFYNIPILSDVIKVMLLIIPINAFGLVQFSILSKELKFKKLAFVSILSAGISGSIGIMLAIANFGIWSLVFQSILMSSINTAFLWFSSTWRPQVAFSFRAIKSHLPFTTYLLLTNLSIVFFNNLYTLLIAKFFNVTIVGYYNQAKRLQEIPTQNITSVFSRVSYSVLSQNIENLSLIKSTYRKVINQTMFINVSIMLFCTFLGGNIIELLFSKKWLPSVPIFQLLCLYGSIFPLHTLNINILKVLGKSKLILQLEIFRRVIMILIIFVSFQFGIQGLLIGQIITAILFVLINMFFCGRQINFTIKEQLKDVFPYFIVSLLSVIPIAVFDNIIHLNLTLKLILELLLVFTFFVASCEFFQIDIYQSIKVKFKRKLISTFK